MFNKTIFLFNSKDSIVSPTVGITTLPRRATAAAISGDRDSDPDTAALVAADSQSVEGESDIAKHTEAALAVFDPEERVDVKISKV